MTHEERDWDEHSDEPEDEDYSAVEMACRACFGPCGRCHELLDDQPEPEPDWTEQDLRDWEESERDLREGW